MPAVTPQFLFDFESNMQIIQEREYARFEKNLWWKEIAKVRTSTSKRERFMWLLTTASIQPAGPGGNIEFDDLVSISTEYTNQVANAGLKLRKEQFEDADGHGLDLGEAWSTQISQYMAYWPQKQIAAMIMNGETVIGYDGVPFFSKLHPSNPFNTGLGTYANLFTGAATPKTGSTPAYPGALPIGPTVTIDVALQNLSTAISTISSVKMPNGVDPRFLTAMRLMVPPALMPRAQQLTGAKFIASPITGGGVAATDISGVVNNWGFLQPLQIQEFAGIDDTSWYIAAEEMGSTQLGAFIYIEREPFHINFYTGEGSTWNASLDRAREYEWHCQGRNVTAPGHPYALFKFKAT